MSKALKNYLLVVTIFLAGLVEAVSGFVLWFALPHSGGGGRWQGAVREFWGLPRETWTGMHDWAAVALIAIAVLHVFMHWHWIARMTQRYLNPGRLLPAPQMAGNSPGTGGK